MDWRQHWRWTGGPFRGRPEVDSTASPQAGPGKRGRVPRSSLCRLLRPQVDRKDNLKRIPKASAHWYAQVMRQNGLPADSPR